MTRSVPHALVAVTEDLWTLKTDCKPGIFPKGYVENGRLVKKYA
jgi:hypothetical protein